MAPFPLKKLLTSIQNNIPLSCSQSSLSIISNSPSHSEKFLLISSNNPSHAVKLSLSLIPKRQPGDEQKISSNPVMKRKISSNPMIKKISNNPVIPSQWCSTIFFFPLFFLICSLSLSFLLCTPVM